MPHSAQPNTLKCPISVDGNHPIPTGGCRGVVCSQEKGKIQFRLSYSTASGKGLHESTPVHTLLSSGRVKEFSLCLSMCAFCPVNQPIMGILICSCRLMTMSLFLRRWTVDSRHRRPLSGDYIMLYGVC